MLNSSCKHFDNNVFPDLGAPTTKTGARLAERGVSRKYEMFFLIIDCTKLILKRENLYFDFKSQ